IAARRLLLLGRLSEAGLALAALDNQRLPPSLAAVAELAKAEFNLRLLDIKAAQAGLDRAYSAAMQAAVPALCAEIHKAQAVLRRPAARLVSKGAHRELRLLEVAGILDSDALVLDGCRRGFRSGKAWLPLSGRPVLFVLASALAQAWPDEVDRDSLIAIAFRTRYGDESHRARLRVEISRLRRLLAPWARIEATPRGFALRPLEQRPVVVLAPPIEGEQAALLALLSDGVAWS